ncbi:MAG: NAD-dependent epimerase/dehydratase family protein [Spirochaetaceae bacterium]|nr:MAG: NAD-dependent epimerase/dehydratase family protein [Spirochaetaceae bacterium]
MKVLLLGGTGTISLPITRRLVERGDQVIVFNRGKRAADPIEGVRYVTGDRKDVAAFTKTIKEDGPYDCVIDMICYGPDEANVDVELFAGLTKQLIFCSTVDVYRKDCLSEYLDLPAGETTEFKPRPSFSYAVNKVKCEEIFEAAHKRGDFAVTVIRPGLTYREGGAPLHPFRGGSYHLDRIVKHKPIIIHGDGTSLWTACHSEDASVAFVNAAGNTKAYGKGYTVASDRWMSWDYYWRATARALGVSDVEIVHIPTDVLERLAPRLSSWIPVHFQFHAIFDISAAETDLGFRNTIPWEDGVARCIAWFRENGGYENSDDYPAYDRLLEAWHGSIEQMARRLQRVEGL